MNYELAYRIGFHPWEDAEAHSPFVEKFSELIDEEGERTRIAVRRSARSRNGQRDLGNPAR